MCGALRMLDGVCALLAASRVHTIPGWYSHLILCSVRSAAALDVDFLTVTLHALLCDLVPPTLTVIENVPELMKCKIASDPERATLIDTYPVPYYESHDTMVRITVTDF